jgi:hypothetical protein
VRWLWIVLLAACASAHPVARAPLRLPRVITLRDPAPAPVASLEEREALARDEAVQDGAQILAAHHERLDGEARLHLVLDGGVCYRAWVGVDGPFAARLEDEHGHDVAHGEAEASLWLEPVCPRWTGSFALVVAPREQAFDLGVLLVSVP